MISEAACDVWRQSKQTNKVNPLKENGLLDAAVRLPAEHPSTVICLEVWGSVVWQRGKKQGHRQRQTDTQTDTQTGMRKT